MAKGFFCKDTRECGMRYKKEGPKKGICLALESGYENDGECPFCKPVANETDGVYYPHRDSLKVTSKYKRIKAV